MTTDLPAQGTCAGFEIRSTLPFRTLRSGSGKALTVEAVRRSEPEGQPVARWHPRPGNPFHGRLIRATDELAFWASDAGWYWIDPIAGSISVEAGPWTLRRELRLFGVPTSVCATEAGDLALHASAVEVDGRAILLAGPSRHGKTTLAAAFARAGHRLLSEDTSRCTLVPRPAVYPGPAAMRLRADVAEWLAVPGAHRLEVDQDRVPLLIEPRLRGDGAPVPLGAILFLRSGVGGPSVMPAARTEAIRDVFALAFQLPNPASHAAAFTRIAELVTAVPVMNLARELDAASLEEVISLAETWTWAA